MDLKSLGLVQLVLFLRHFSATSSADVQCDPAEIGTNHSISCSSSVVNDSITWHRAINQVEIPIWQCFMNTKCVPYLDTYKNQYNADIYNISRKYTSTLVIYNIHQTLSAFLNCGINSQSSVPVCSPLIVYSKPSGITCNETLTINEQNKTTIICFITKVYPSAKMMLNATGFTNTVNCVQDTSSGSISITCISDIPITRMKAGINFIDVLIYPDVMKGEMLGIKKQLNISLAFPTPSLGQDCLNILNTTQGYIKQGTSANCTCYVKTQGVPPGGVKWFYKNGTEVWSVINRESAVLQVMFVGKETSHMYSCVGVSLIGKDENKIEVFTVNNAYGPEDLSLLPIENKYIYEICKTTSLINISCSVPKQSVVPEPSVKISVSGGEILVINLNHNSTHYIYVSAYGPKTTGGLTFKCEALNSIFNELHNLKNVTVLVSGPPSQPPILTIGQQSYSGNYVKTVEPQKEGSDLDITCQVSGGFPNTYNMTVSCGGNYNNSVTNSDVVKLSFKKVGKQLNGELCVCKAEHVASCYVNNTSSIELNITFPAEVLRFTANSNSSSLTVSNNSDVTFVCDTESNPPAVVEISKTELVTNNTGKVNFTIQVKCQNSGEYICWAHNSEFKESKESSLLLYVQCTLQLKYFTDNYKEIPVRKGQNAVIKFNVLGFPAPVSYSLFKNNIEYEYVPDFNSDSSAKTKYQFKYIPNDLPFGSIDVTIINMTASDFTNYTLIVNNGIDAGLNLNFVLIEDNSNGEQDVDILPAAIGGGIASFAFVVVTIIIIILLFKEDLHNHKLWKKTKYIIRQLHAEQEYLNSDIYILNVKDGLDMEINFKNYSDVPITITTATALPRNLKLISKQNHMTTYCNSYDGSSDGFSIKEANKTHLLKKENKQNDQTDYNNDVSFFQKEDTDVYANT